MEPTTKARMNSVGNPDPLAAVRPSPIEGNGVFARRAIAAGTRVIEYVGEKVSKAESHARCEANNVCIFALDEDHDLDGNVPWNPARFVNHSCAPNCEATEDDGRIWIVARHDIAAGEELTFNYGYDLEDYREHPCRCGTPECAGYIVAEEFFAHVRKQRQQLGSTL
jgi:SET domain-containing protein